MCLTLSVCVNTINAKSAALPGKAVFPFDPNMNLLALQFQNPLTNMHIYNTPHTASVCIIVISLRPPDVQTNSSESPKPLLPTAKQHKDDG